MTEEIVPETIIWYPGMDYLGRKDAYAQPASSMSPDMLVALVQTRAREDGEWVIENGRVGPNNENADLMHRMMEWVATPLNIIQCYKANPEKTVDWICRDLANAAKWVAGSHE